MTRSSPSPSPSPIPVSHRIVTSADKAVTIAADVTSTVTGHATMTVTAHVETSGGARARRAAVVACMLLAAACGDTTRLHDPPRALADHGRAAADFGKGITTELDRASPQFVDGLLAEVTGDPDSARAEFEAVLAAPGASGELAGRAALHLAQMEARAGQSRHALDFVARAAALAPNDLAIEERIKQLRAEIVAVAGAGDLRGPRVGTALANVTPEVAAQWTTAEAALVAAHRLRPRAVIEALSTSIRAKEAATENAVARYRAVAEHGGVAAVAGHYRAGSLYHDLAINLLFELPSELDASVAAGLRRTLHSRALAYLKKGVAEYRTALAEAPSPDAELWRAAAETDLRPALEVLGGTE